ncbi:hypothetical protein QR680_011344 [Steinernema hermaphroditum]|uniref:Vacuolar protein sorting-associated protein 51 homolog n=1 Tax=Steinernema hermaphroditum TaxID=289476 RepID=A0AA39MD22_9BILA|nr:hypothetical protein QR680_011344 [Steinernema hermaphroditum]
MEEAKIPLNACKKIFIERDYSSGLTVRFQTTFPTRLTGMISPDAWDNVITTLNTMFAEAERVCSSTVMETLVGCFTCYISRAFAKTIYERNLEGVMAYIDEQNRDLFMPAGLFLSDPMERGLRLDMESNSGGSVDLHSSDFVAENYVSQLLKKKGLDELVQVEEDMVHNIRRLDSDMQQLVYENYNKFLTATSTVRNMQKEFAEMDKEMGSLADSMNKISSLSQDLCGVFSKHRESVRKLNDANKTVKSLQFIFNLPEKLLTLFDEKHYAEAVKSFTLVKPKLNSYKNVPSVANIYNESVEIVKQIEAKLRERMTDRNSSSEEVTEAVRLLVDLEVPMEDLRGEMMRCWNENLSDELEKLEKASYLDVLEFVDSGCSTFLTNISLVTSLHSQLFARLNEHDLIELVDGLMQQLEQVVLQRFISDDQQQECSILVRALDRIYRRISASNHLLPGLDYSAMGLSIVINVSKHQVKLSRKSVIQALHKAIEEIHKEMDTPTSALEPKEELKVDQFVAKLEQNFLVYLKTALANLLLFTASDVTFSGFETTQFAAGFGIDVHEGVVIGCLEDLCDLGGSSLGARKATPPMLMLVVAQFVYNTQGKSLAYIIDLCQEQFRLVGHRDRKSKKLTKTEAITAKVQKGAEQLLKKYVDARAMELSQLIVNGVESRDWLACKEPRAVRSVMKRFVEHLENMDSLLKQIMDSDATKKERTPESIRASSAARARNIHSTFDTGSLSSTLERMWTEKIEIFEKVHFKRDSVLSAIVKMCLKSFLESVRLQTFGRYGLEQIQVDCYFLQQQLWKYVSDEAVVTSMIDEIVSSVVHRSVQPKIMEPAAVKEICDRA